MALRLSLAGLIVGLAFTCPFLTGCRNALEADLILINGKIVTLDNHSTVAQAVAIRSERIERVGSTREIRALAGRDTRVIDLEGRTVIPGFNDAHLHLESGGFLLLQVNLIGVTSLEEFQQRVRAAVERQPEGSWIQGRGWDHTLLPGSRWPTKDLLDRVVPRNPAYLKRICGHVALVNSAALAVAGITRDTPDPEGGRIVRDRNGNPTGILEEDACTLVSDVIPERTLEEQRRAIKVALQELARFGITSVQEMGTSSGAFTVYQDLLDREELTVRIYACPNIDSGSVHLPGLGIRTGLGNPWLRLGALKGYADGALGAATAALLEPYSDHPDSRGIIVTPVEEIRRLILGAHTTGRQVTFHAIGDRGNRVVLDAYEQAIRAYPRPDHRHRIEHVQVVALEDIPRFAELGVIASMQPVHCTSDMRWAEDRIGPERVKGAYAWHSLLRSGARLAFGTDWPNDHLAPMRSLYAAVTRKDTDGNPEDGWHPEERLTLEETLRAYTLGSAYASFEEDIKGSIEEGNLADLVVLSRPILDIPPAEILETEVLMTIVGGRVVYEKQ